MSQALPRLLLIEDDASLRRFVALALEDRGVELAAVATVDEGLAALRAGRFALVLSDLMLPDRSGFELVDALADEPRLLADARLVIFSAGLDADTRRRLQRPQVWRLLAKPCTVAELQACVSDGLVGRTDPAAALSAAETAKAVQHYFGGDQALFLAFRAHCLQQFPADLAAADRALAAGDLGALCHLAHSLKSVLLMNGEGAAAQQARELEDLCTAGDAGSARALWPALRGRIAAFRADS